MTPLSISNTHMYTLNPSKLVDRLDLQVGNYIYHNSKLWSVTNISNVTSENIGFRTGMLLHVIKKYGEAVVIGLKSHDGKELSSIVHISRYNPPMRVHATALKSGDWVFTSSFESSVITVLRENKKPYVIRKELFKSMVNTFSMMTHSGKELAFVNLPKTRKDRDQLQFGYINLKDLKMVH